MRISIVTKTPDGKELRELKTEVADELTERMGWALQSLITEDAKSGRIWIDNMPVNLVDSKCQMLTVFYRSGTDGPNNRVGRVGRMFVRIPAA